MNWIRPTLVIACTALMLGTNLFGGGSDFSGEGADPSMYYTYPTPFSPAPFTFAIWLPIFIGCCALAVYQALPAQAARADLDRFALPYCGALLANASTPFLKIGWSNLVVTLLFVLLALSVVHLPQRNATRADARFLKLPTTFFAAWCGVATLVNLCQWLVSIGVGVTPALAALFVCAAMALGALALRKTQSVAIAVVMLWAGVGIAFAQPNWNVISTAVLVTSLVTAALAATVFFQAQKNKESMR